MSEAMQKNRSLRKIGGLKLINTGLKGVEIRYETAEIIDGVQYSSEDLKKSFRPAHRELKALMKEFVSPLIELCGYRQENVNPYDFEVTGITAGTEQFIISGKYRCWGDKVISINTPLIKEGDAYEHFNDVVTLVDNVYKEIDLYLSGVKKITKKEVIVDYMKDVKKNETFKIEDDFSSMNDEEWKLMLKEINKDLGIVVHMEDGKMVIGASDDDQEVEAVASQLVAEEGIEDAVEVVEPAVIEANMELPTMPDDNDLDFEL
ncbi:MAG: hypothetical protein IT212_07700 [Bacteroidia bacterium]|nr:hypothetical protein [Bacteroidia bacterium]